MTAIDQETSNQTPKALRSPPKKAVKKERDGLKVERDALKVESAKLEAEKEAEKERGEQKVATLCSQLKDMAKALRVEKEKSRITIAGLMDEVEQDIVDSEDCKAAAGDMLDEERRRSRESACKDRRQSAKRVSDREYLYSLSLSFCLLLILSSSLTLFLYTTQ